MVQREKSNTCIYKDIKTNSCLVSSTGRALVLHLHSGTNPRRWHTGWVLSPSLVGLFFLDLLHISGSLHHISIKDRAHWQCTSTICVYYVGHYGIMHTRIHSRSQKQTNLSGFISCLISTGSSLMSAGPITAPYWPFIPLLTCEPPLRRWFLKKN